MANHRYISVAHVGAPFRQLPFQGLGATRTYYETAIFRAPYKTGYYQDNSLFGLGATNELEQAAQNVPPPSSAWRRDLETALNQIPPWAYGVMSVALLGTAYLAYKRHKKKGASAEPSQS